MALRPSFLLPKIVRDLANKRSDWSLPPPSVVAAATLVRRLIPDRSFTAEDPYIAAPGRVNIARPFFIALGGSNPEK